MRNLDEERVIALGVDCRCVATVELREIDEEGKGRVARIQRGKPLGEEVPVVFFRPVELELVSRLPGFEPAHAQVDLRRGGNRGAQPGGGPPICVPRSGLLVEVTKYCVPEW